MFFEPFTILVSLFFTFLLLVLIAFRNKGIKIYSEFIEAQIEEEEQTIIGTRIMVGENKSLDIYLNLIILNEKKNPFKIDSIEIKKENCFYFSTANIKTESMPFYVKPHEKIALQIRKEWIDVVDSIQVIYLAVKGNKKSLFKLNKKQLKKLLLENQKYPSSIKGEIYEPDEEGLFEGFKKKQFVEFNTKLKMALYGPASG